ncbi:secreted protein [Melampsora americana]|nr:secreted protein [Melampsora americana]KAH9818363.1 secreted protein [Melampsora americana]
MSWIRSIPIFTLLLVFLLAEDLGLNIFADANAIDCTYGWSPPNRDPRRKDHYMCLVQRAKDVDTYLCDMCGRADRHIPAAKDCVDEDGKVVNNGGVWNCDQGMDGDNPRPDGRLIICNHTDKNGIVDGYNCKARTVFQQCPEGHCSKV